VAALLDAWPDGRIKLFATLAALGLRREQPSLFVDGEYLPLEARLPKGAEAVAFARRLDGAAAIAIAPTLVRGLAPDGFATGDRWQDGRVLLSQALPDAAYLNVLTGETARVQRGEEGPFIALAGALKTLPMALFVQRGGD
jgi:(1->4)-alpha-D-glucan 1-alpha-D-glucosylmutase